MDILLQDLQTQGVKGADIPRVLFPDHGAHPLLHFVGGFIGKGHTEDVLRRDAHDLRQIGVAPGQSTGLARACSRRHPNIPFGSGHSLLLRLIEPLQNIHIQTSKK